MELKRNLVIEFCGMPKSGKTTVMDTVSHYFRRSGYKDRLMEFHGGGRYAPIHKSEIAKLNLYLATEAMRYLLCADNPDCINKIHLMDRGINDRMIFSDALKHQRKISEEESRIVYEMLSFPEISKRTDLCFVFITSAELSMERENKNKIVHGDGRVMNKELLNCLRKSALDYYENRLCGSAKKFVLIDTQKLDGNIIECAKIIIKEMEEFVV